MTAEKHGVFPGWILTAQEPCWTSRFSPGIDRPGQSEREICLGCGDFSVFPNLYDGYLYLFYTKHFIQIDQPQAVKDEVYLARCRLDELDDVTVWKKYTDSGFTAPGNCGQDVSVLTGGAIPSVCKDPKHDRFVMSTYNRDAWRNGLCTCQLSFSEDLLHWDTAGTYRNQAGGCLQSVSDAVPGGGVVPGVYECERHGYSLVYIDDG